MDVSTITDIEKLKAMAYDCIAEKERAEGNLAIINRRIQELLDAKTEPATKKTE